MERFSATEAAFTGFRLVREHPRVIAVWAVANIVVTLAFGILMTATAGPALMTLQAQGFTGGRDPAQSLAALRQLAPVYAGLAVAVLVFYPVLYAAMARAVLSPQDERFGYFRLGADELRQLGVMLLVVLIGMAFYILLILVIVLVAASARGTAGAALGVLIGAIAVVAVIAAWIHVGVRLSLAWPLTFATRKVDLMGSWALTRGRFWPILGTYLLSWCLAAVVYLLGFAVIAAFVAVAGGGMAGLATILHPDLSSLAAYLSPARLVQIFLSGILTAMIWPVVLTPPAAIYRALAAPTDRRTAEVFS